MASTTTTVVPTNEVSSRVRARARVACAVWLAALAAVGCNAPPGTGDLVGHYAVRGVLVENSCGQTALATPNPLEFQVEVREDTGVGYWMPSNQTRNVGTLNARGEFRFTTTTTRVLSEGSTRPLSPSDFTSPQPDFDLQQQQQPPCAVTIRQTVTGQVERRLGADGVSVVTLSEQPDGGPPTGSDDLTADNLIEITPASGSDCSGQLAAFGGTYLALPCSASYVMVGTLRSAAQNATTAAPPIEAAAGSAP